MHSWFTFYIEQCQKIFNETLMRVLNFIGETQSRSEDINKIQIEFPGGVMY